MGEFFHEESTSKCGEALPRLPFDIGGSTSGSGGLEQWDGMVGGAFTGDFYRDPDHITRGVVMPASDIPQVASFHGDDEFKVPPFADFHREDAVGFPGLAGIEAASGSMEHVRFEEKDVAPLLPSDPYFKVEATTLFIQRVENSGAAVANALLDVLNQEVAAEITKVSKHKLAVRATIFMDRLACAAKMRVYSRGPGGDLVLEFQRRSGDPVAFAFFFQKASEALALRTGGLTGDGERQRAPRAVLLPPPLPFTCTAGNALALGDGDVLPLLDLAGYTEAPPLQAEAASALAGVAHEGKSAALCTEKNFQEFRKLLKADHTEVVYPTAQLLSSLARCPLAEPHFAGMLPVMLEKVCAAPCDGLVQQELAAAFGAASALCAAALSASALSEVLALVDIALAGAAAGSAVVHKNLMDARSDLQSRAAHHS